MRKSNSLKIWINNRFADMRNAKVSVFDRGFLYGDGVFETMRSYAGKVFRIDDHLIRLFTSLEALKIRSPYSRKYLKAAIYGTLERNRLESAYIRLTMTRGEGRFGLAYNDTFKPNVVIVAKEFGDYPERFYRRGIRVAITSVRQNEDSPLCGRKTLSFLNYIVARFDAKVAGADEAVLLNTRGMVAEGATSNVFLIKNNSLITPSLNSCVVPGVTRSVIIKIAERLRFRVKERAVPYKELLRSDEVFITNSLVEVLPVTTVDSQVIGQGVPGELTKLFHISYQKEVIREVLA